MVILEKLSHVEISKEKDNKISDFPFQMHSVLLVYCLCGFYLPNKLARN